MRIAFACRACGSPGLRHHTFRSRMCADCDTRRDKERRKAHEAVRAAVAAGLIRPANEMLCVDCGGPACDHDHRDYTKPLEVAPVCRSCNLRRPLALDSVYRGAAETV